MKVKELRPGDRFQVGKDKTAAVTSVVVGPPGCRDKTHINKTLCYESETECLLQHS